MPHFYITLGSVLIALTLADTFFTVFNYNERGLLVNRAIAWEWRFLNWLFRPLGLQTRSRIYRAMTGFTLLSGILIWVAGIVVGFAFIYWGAQDLGSLAMLDDAPDGFVGALYFSIAQFSTVGVDNVEARSNIISILSVSETLSSVLLLSMVITYLVNIFNSIEDLRKYCACFTSRSEQVDSPLTALAPFLPREEPSSLENHLANTRQAMNSYFDSIAADHSAIYFNSGKPRFMMPFAVFFTAGTIEGLSYGLGAGHPNSLLPELLRLSESLESNRRQIYTLFRWREPDGGDPLGINAFTEAAEVAARIPEDKPLADPGLINRKPLPVRVAKNLNVKAYKEQQKQEQLQTPEAYVARFVRLRQVVTRLAQLDPPDDWRKEYDLYAAWIKDAPITDDFIRRISGLFDYRPVVKVGPDSSGAPLSMYGWQSEDGSDN